MLCVVSVIEGVWSLSRTIVIVRLVVDLVVLFLDKLLIY